VYGFLNPKSSLGDDWGIGKNRNQFGFTIVLVAYYTTAGFNIVAILM